MVGATRLQNQGCLGDCCALLFKAVVLHPDWTPPFLAPQITYSSLISACEKASQWEVALRIFDEMQQDGCAPNTVTYNSLITACGQGKKACPGLCGNQPLACGEGPVLGF